MCLDSLIIRQVSLWPCMTVRATPDAMHNRALDRCVLYISQAPARAGLGLAEKKGPNVKARPTAGRITLCLC